MQGNRIRAFVAAGEAERAKHLALAICEDPRFYPLEINAEIPVDVQFRAFYQHDGIEEFTSPHIFNC